MKSISPPIKLDKIKIFRRILDSGFFFFTSSFYFIFFLNGFKKEKKGNHEVKKHSQPPPTGRIFISQIQGRSSKKQYFKSKVQIVLH